MNRRVLRHHRQLTGAIAAVAASMMLAPAAYASGSSMPWEQPLQQILQSIEGPVAKIVAVIIIIATGLGLAFGDTSGGLSPIAGIDKAFLRQWLRWRQTEGPAECGPLPALEAITAQAPTAELRPPAATQAVALLDGASEEEVFPPESESPEEDFPSEPEPVNTPPSGQTPDPSPTPPRPGYAGGMTDIRSDQE